MSLFEDNPTELPPEPGDSPGSPDGASKSISADSAPLPGDPITYVAIHPEAAHPPSDNLPEDLRISWSWLHLLVFGIFGVISFVAVQLAFAIYYIPARQHFANNHEFEQFIFSKPLFAVGSMVLWEASLLFFLYITIALLPDAPFWRSLGWRTLTSSDPAGLRKPWPYLFLGGVLSIGVFIVTARAKAPDNAPIEELFKHRSTMFWFMAMAVLFAPVAEETLFRGYLYPLVARLTSAAAFASGVERSEAVRQGMWTSVVLTGAVFGLVHGYQLGWSAGLVLTLMAVGIVFTYVRARTGTVYASYLLHLGYNSTIALFTLIGFVVTKGFTKMPPH